MKHLLLTLAGVATIGVVGALMLSIAHWITRQMPLGDVSAVLMLIVGILALSALVRLLLRGLK